jgi:predicted small lipoprotein YifL
MRSTLHTIIVFALLVGLVLVLVACGGKGNGGY